MKPVSATLEAACPPAVLFGWVDDLARYPRWLDLVQRAEPAGDETWTVVLAARMGPLRRSKQLTMVRTRCEPGRLVRFERREPDGKRHAAWTLQAAVMATRDGSELTMTMTYDGQWWGPVVERVLTEEIDRARPRLAALAAAG